MKAAGQPVRAARFILQWIGLHGVIDTQITRSFIEVSEIVPKIISVNLNAVDCGVHYPLPLLTSFPDITLP